MFAKTQKSILVLVALCGLHWDRMVVVPSVSGQMAYQAPPAEVVQLVDAAPEPIGVLSPRGDALALIGYVPHPPLELLARPIARLAGIRIDLQRNCRQRLTEWTSLAVLTLSDGVRREIRLPEGSRISRPRWSPDGTKLAFLREQDDGWELWIADLRTDEARAVPNVRLNDVLTVPFRWTRDNRRILIHTVPVDRPPCPERPRVPQGPIIEETSGKRAQVRTYQDLLKTPFDEQLFEYLGTSDQLAVNERIGSMDSVI